MTESDLPLLRRHSRLGKDTETRFVLDETENIPLSVLIREATHESNVDVYDELHARVPFGMSPQGAPQSESKIDYLEEDVKKNSGMYSI